MAETTPDIPAEAVDSALDAYQQSDEFADWLGDRDMARPAIEMLVAAALPHLHEWWLAGVKLAIERLTPCRCDPAYTERGLHQSDCLLEIREDVFDVLGAGGEP